MKILVTGVAGFIGFHLARRLLERGDAVVGLDSINDYYDPALKYSRLAELGVDEAAARAGLAHGARYPEFEFGAYRLRTEWRWKRYSPFTALIESAIWPLRRASVTASRILGHTSTPILWDSSTCLSVAGRPRFRTWYTHPLHRSMGWERNFHSRPMRRSITRPASTRPPKRADELLAHTYSHLFQLPTTGLRFFTVYGPWGRPDMAYFKFAEAIIQGQEIDVYNNGDMLRDFTYIDDIIEGTMRVLDGIPTGDPGWNPALPDPASSSAPYRVYNIGNNKPVRLLDFIAELERALGTKARKRYLPMQPGDVYATEADVR